MLNVAVRFSKMSSQSANLAMTRPNLRLAGSESEEVRPSQAAAARRAVAQENHGAALAADDVRRVFAEHVRASVEGGRAAIVRPEARRRLVSSAEKMGLRPFDANLVIAIVQDAARHGETLDEDAAHRLGMVPARGRKSVIGPLMLLGAAVGLAAGLISLLVAWVMG